MKRFIVLVLDSFGVGAMDDVKDVRPLDVGSSTCMSLLKYESPKKWDNILGLGLMNAVGEDYKEFKKSEKAIFGTSNLKHFGADSFFGHQEIAGTNPKKPIFSAMSAHINDIESSLVKEGFDVVRLEKDGLELLKVDNLICVGDNMETDLGQAINVVGAMDYCGMDMIKKVGHIVRQEVKVPRVIAFGGSKVTIDDITNAMITKEGKFIGIDAPGSGVYETNYHVEHIGYGVDTSKQVPIALHKVGINNYFYGKVSNIVHNPGGTNFDAVDTDEIFIDLLKDLKQDKEGFYFINIQETDLAGHAQDCERYIDRMNLSDAYIGKIMNLMNHDDILIVMADHGNDPMIGHARHTRERVPLLIYRLNNDKLINIGNRVSMADVGQTVADYFNTEIEYGESFLKDII